MITNHAMRLVNLIPLSCPITYLQYNENAQFVGVANMESRPLLFVPISTTGKVQDKKIRRCMRKHVMQNSIPRRHSQKVSNTHDRVDILVISQKLRHNSCLGGREMHCRRTGAEARFSRITCTVDWTIRPVCLLPYRHGFYGIISH